MGYLIFIFVIVCLFFIGEFTRKHGLEKLTIRREADKEGVFEGEEIKITTIIENNKWLPISFLVIREKMPLHIEYFSEGSYLYSGNHSFHKSQYSVSWFQRIRRPYTIKIKKRGTYSLRSLTVSVGDFFGFSSDTIELEDYLELIVYPKLIDISKFQFQSTSLQGESIVKRWIYQDPLYIKGIREYSVEDRMKDIHWKSSLKMGKLMVKEYDYTSEREVVIIQNVQCGENHWGSIDEQAIENGIRVGASIAAKAIREGVPAGLWTNAQIVSYYKNPNSEVEPSIHSLRHIMELYARIDYSTRVEFEEYLKAKARSFRHNCTYIIITPFLSEEIIYLMMKLRRAGFMLKIIDVSMKGEISKIEGIEQIRYGGENAK